MMSLFGGFSVLSVPVLAQLFPDINGYLVSDEFFRILANLVTSFILSLISVLLGIDTTGGA